jgi:Holliday junction resolvasome RuvABC endonuclease subunit
MKILAIDPGTRCGFALRWADGRIDSGTWELAPRRDEGPGMRLVRLVAHLTKLLALAQPDLVVVEEVRRHAGTQAAHVYGALVGRVQEECERRRLNYTSVPVSDVKRAAVGRGGGKGCDKAAMIAAANERWGLSLKAADENEADARWIAEAAWRQYGVTPNAEVQRAR